MGPPRLSRCGVGVADPDLGSARGAPLHGPYPARATQDVDPKSLKARQVSGSGLPFRFKICPSLSQDVAVRGILRVVRTPTGRRAADHVAAHRSLVAEGARTHRYYLSEI